MPLPIEFALIPIGVFGLSALASSIVFTKEKHLTFISMFGKYNKTLDAGIGFKIPFITKVDTSEYTGRNQHPVSLTVKTGDQTTLTLGIKIFYSISGNVSEAYKAVYNTESYTQDMDSLATDRAVSVVNGMTLNEVFSSKDDIREEIKQALVADMENYGIKILDVTCDEPQLPAAVEATNNELLIAKREKEAATDRAETIRITKTGDAQADGEAVKIRLGKIGEARKQFAAETTAAVQEMVAGGIPADIAIKFMSDISAQDAMISAAKYGNMVIVQSGQEGSRTIDPMQATLTGQMMASAKQAKPDNGTK